MNEKELTDYVNFITKTCHGQLTLCIQQDRIIAESMTHFSDCIVFMYIDSKDKTTTFKCDYPLIFSTTNLSDINLYLETAMNPFDELTIGMFWFDISSQKDDLLNFLKLVLLPAG